MAIIQQQNFFSKLERKIKDYHKRSPNLIFQGYSQKVQNFIGTTNMQTEKYPGKLKIPIFLILALQNVDNGFNFIFNSYRKLGLRQNKLNEIILI